MKVKGAEGKSPNPAAVHEKGEKRIAANGETAFESRLKTAESFNYEKNLHELADRITQQGKKLGEKIDIRELKIYKKLISEFLDEAVSGSSRFFKQSTLDRRGRHRIFAIVKKIDRELELLAEDVISGEKDNIGILKRLDEIKGLILDIIL